MGDQSVRTGVWTPARINFLEMKGVQLALQMSVSAKNNIHILLIDNSTTIAYINHKGGKAPPSSGYIGMVHKQISLHAEHIPGVVNTVVDAKLRTQATGC